MISFSHCSTFYGPNPYSLEPVVLFDLQFPENDLAILSDAAILLADLSVDWYVKPDNSVRKSPDKLIVEFICDWSFQLLTFVRGFITVSGNQYLTEKKCWELWLGFNHPKVSVSAVKLAVNWLNSISKAEDTKSLGAAINDFWRLCKIEHPDYQARILFEAARSVGIPYQSAWGVRRYWRFGQGKNSQVMFESSSLQDSWLGANIATSKDATKQVLVKLGVPTPLWRLVNKENELLETVNKIGYPCVLKPLDRGGGKGVSAGLLDFEAVKTAYLNARKFSNLPIMVEAFAGGHDYRLMVINGKFIAAFRREAPSIVGDGKHSIRELVIQKNISRHADGLAFSNYKRPIILDESAALHLKTHGLKIDDIISRGQVVSLRGNSNLSTGGEGEDVTDLVHEDIKKTAEFIAVSLNLNMLGLDYLTDDITQSPSVSGGVFIEINSTPGLDLMVGSRWSCERLAKVIFDEKVGRIPIDLLVFPMENFDENLQHVYKFCLSKKLNFASSRKAIFSGIELNVAENRVWSGIELLLNNALVDRGLFIVNINEIYKFGLPLDRIDRSIFLNVNITENWQKVFSKVTGTVKEIKDLDSVFQFLQ